MITYRSLRRILAIVVTLAFLAGCSEDDPDSTETTGEQDGEEQQTEEEAGEEEAGEAEETEDASTGAEGDSAVPEETGPADDSLEPVKIGWINNDDGPVSFPATTAGFETAIAYINDKLGGIDGHPVEGVLCSAALEQDSVRQCAQQMANDDSIDVVTSGYMVVSEPVFPVLEQAGKPILVGNPLNVPDFTNPDTALAFMPGNPGISAGAPVYVVDHEDAEKVAIVVSNNDAGRSAMGLAEMVLEDDPVEIASVFVNDDEADYTGPIQAAGAADADAFVPLVAQPGCIQVANAISTLGLDVPVGTTGLCGAPEVREAVGEKILGWTIGATGPLPQFAEPGTEPEADHYNEVFPEYGDEEMMYGPAATSGFSMALALWEIGNEIGYDALSPDTWFEGMKAFEGPVYLGPRTLACGSVEAFPGLCSTASRWFTITEDGLEDATGGVPVDPFNR